MAKLSLVWLRESCSGSPGKWSDWVCSSTWLSSCCLPRRLPAEERFRSYQRQVTCLESSCHQVSSLSGPREHLSPSLNWLQHLIKALLRDEGDKNDAPMLRRRLKQNVPSDNYICSLFGHKPPNLLHIPNWASNFEHYCYIFVNIPACGAPFVLSASLFTTPHVSKHCQPDSTVTGGERTHTTPVKSHTWCCFQAKSNKFLNILSRKSTQQSVFYPQRSVAFLKIVLCSLGIFSATRWHTWATSVETLTEWILYKWEAWSNKYKHLSMSDTHEETYCSKNIVYVF